VKTEDKWKKKVRLVHYLELNPRPELELPELRLLNHNNPPKI